MPWVYNPFTGKLDWTAPTPTITPGGSSGQVQWNNGGAFAGASGITTNGTELTIASGTKTTSAPIQDLSQTWNAAGVTFTGWRLNVTDTASNADSQLLDLQVGGTSRFRFTKSGALYTGSSGGGLEFSAEKIVVFRGTAGSEGRWLVFQSNSGAYALKQNQYASFGWTGGITADTTLDTVLVRDAANTLAQRNSTNAQTFRIYNTFTDASNHERGKIEWSSNVLRIGTEKAGTGTARALELQTDGTTRLTIGATTGDVSVFSSATTPFAVYNSSSVEVLGTQSNGNVRVGLQLNVTGACVAGRLVLDTTNQDVQLFRDAANTFGQRSGTAAQTFNIYNTFTSTTNFERLSIAATSGGAVRICTNKGSGGGTARALELGTDNITALTLTTAQKAEFAQTIKTAAPTSGTAAEWKLGTVATVSPTSPNRTIEVEIGGTTYYLSAKTTND